MPCASSRISITAAGRIGASRTSARYLLYLRRTFADGVFGKRNARPPKTIAGIVAFGDQIGKLVHPASFGTPVAVRDRDVLLAAVTHHCGQRGHRCHAGRQHRATQQGVDDRALARFASPAIRIRIRSAVGRSQSPAMRSWPARSVRTASSPSTSSTAARQPAVGTTASYLSGRDRWRRYRGCRRAPPPYLSQFTQALIRR